MAWTTRKELLKLFERERARLSASDLAQLHRSLRLAGRVETEAALRDLRMLAVERMQMTPAAARRHLETMAPEQRPVVLYATAAWAAKALSLFEFLEKSDLDERYPAKWAAEKGLRILDEYEAETVWLWPFEEPGPFEAEEDD